MQSVFCVHANNFVLSVRKIKLYYAYIKLCFVLQSIWRCEINHHYKIHNIRKCLFNIMRFMFEQDKTFHSVTLYPVTNMHGEQKDKKVNESC